LRRRKKKFRLAKNEHAGEKGLCCRLTIPNNDGITFRALRGKKLNGLFFFFFYYKEEKSQKIKGVLCIEAKSSISFYWTRHHLRFLRLFRFLTKLLLEASVTVPYIIFFFKMPARDAP
jgi:hypothetical protein